MCTLSVIAMMILVITAAVEDKYKEKKHKRWYCALTGEEAYIQQIVRRAQTVRYAKMQRRKKRNVRVHGRDSRERKRIYKRCNGMGGSGGGNVRESIVDNNGTSMDIAIHNIAQRSLGAESMAKALSELSLQNGATTGELENGVKTINRYFEEYEAKNEL